MFADFFAGLAIGTGIGILIDPRLRSYVADAQWRSGRGVDSLTTELLERLRQPDPRDLHEAISDEFSNADAAPAVDPPPDTPAR